MGIFKNVFGGKREQAVSILAPLAGELIAVSQVSDPTFSEELLGKGAAIRPNGNRVVSPVNGIVVQMFDTGHAVNLLSDDGVEVLVHVGLDTIRLKGEHYTILAQDGDRVKAGDPLIEFDREAIAAAGYDTVTPVVVCNSAEFQSVELVGGGQVRELDEILRLSK